MIKSGSPEDLERMMARMDTESSRPIDDPAPIRDFPKYGRPLVYVGGIYGKAVGWTHKYGLIEWLDFSDKYHMGWAHSSSIKRVEPGRVEGQFAAVAGTAVHQEDSKTMARSSAEGPGHCIVSLAGRLSRPAQRRRVRD